MIKINEITNGKSFMIPLNRLTPTYVDKPYFWDDNCTLNTAHEYYYV